METFLSEELKAIRMVVRKFAREVVLPQSQQGWNDYQALEGIIAQAGSLGIQGLAFPAEYGGSGAGTLAYTVALEEVAWADNSFANYIMATGTPSHIINRFGTHEQKQRWLPPLLSGHHVGSIGLTEPDAGSDLASVRTTARKKGSDWVIDGTKIFISGSGTPISGAVVVLAQTPDVGGLSLFILNPDLPGFHVKRTLKKIGWAENSACELVFDHCLVPEDRLVGVPGKGLRQMLEVLGLGRVAIAAMGVGICQAALDRSLEYATQRYVMGRRIAQFEAIQFKLADMWARAENARLVTYHAARLADDRHPDFSMAASLAKLTATESAMTSAHQAIQIYGGNGIMHETHVSRLLGDAKVLEIVEGTSEIQRWIIARTLLRDYDIDIKQ